MVEHPQSERFLEAYDELADAIFRHCYYRVYDRERAKELVQDCFLRTWQYLVKGGEIGSLKAFLYRTAVNLVVDESRRRRSVSLEEAMEAGWQPVEPSAGPELAGEVAGLLGALEQVEPKYREVVRLRYLDGLGPKEIALVLGQTENAVSVRLHRGLARLKVACGVEVK